MHMRVKIAEFIQSVRGRHIPRAIIFRAFVGIFPLYAEIFNDFLLFTK